MKIPWIYTTYAEWSRGDLEISPISLYPNAWQMVTKIFGVLWTQQVILSLASFRGIYLMALFTIVTLVVKSLTILLNLSCGTAMNLQISQCHR